MYSAGFLKFASLDNRDYTELSISTRNIWIKIHSHTCFKLLHPPTVRHRHCQSRLHFPEKLSLRWCHLQEWSSTYTKALYFPIKSFISAYSLPHLFYSRAVPQLHSLLHLPSSNWSSSPLNLHRDRLLFQLDIPTLFSSFRNGK